MSTPTNIILEESKLSSIQDRAIFLCNSFLIKVLSNNNLLTNKNIHDFQLKVKKNKNKRKRFLHRCIEECYNLTKDKLLINKQFNIYTYDFQEIIQKIPIMTEIGKTLKQSSNPTLKLKELAYQPNYLNIYTDGSKNPSASSVGSACICKELNISIKLSLPPEASIFTAESIAINEVLNIALKNVNSNYNIYTDSLSILQSFQTNKLNIKFNPYLLQAKLKYLEFQKKSTNNCCINFIWVPSHIGIEGNEDADSLAKSATLLTYDNHIRIPHTDFQEI